MPISTRRAAARKAIKARRWRKPTLYIKQILQWADNHFEQTGRWPRHCSGRVRGTLAETWMAVDSALRAGTRGLPGGDSVARVLARYRGVRNPNALPPFTVDRILAWADAYFQRHGAWPRDHSGPVEDAPGETWMAVTMALTKGRRGLPGGSSLAQLLAKHRGKRNSAKLPSFSIARLLKWADAHHRRTGMWPTLTSGPVLDAPGETWTAIDDALRRGIRGMRGGSSLPRLLHRHRNVAFNQARRRSLTIAMILAWADAYHNRTGRWPKANSGQIVEAPGETWGKMHNALRFGKRGLRRRSSLAKLLAEHRGVRNVQNLPKHSIKKILAWADAHFKRHGRWPTSKSGPLDEAPSETWVAINVALIQGRRGLPGGSSLARLLTERRGMRNRGDLPKFTVAQILEWADAHHDRTGAWPQVRTSPIFESPLDTWGSVEKALRDGRRGLQGGSTLKRLLDRHRRNGRAK